MKFFSFLKKKKPVIGLALGSGGAKGFAHLGALKAFEENDITFDVVGGTSIGSIIGAFYADGYSSTDIHGLIDSLSLKDLLNGIPFNMDMSNVKTILDRQIGGKKIEELKKPFLCIATDADTMEEVVILDGKVSTALCASSCFMPFFKPVVDTNGRRLIDGAYQNSIPADRILEHFSPDYIVGVDLSAFKDYENAEVKQGARQNPSEQGYKYCNVMVKPDLTSFKAIEYSAKNEMYELGYKSALDVIDKIKQDFKKLKIKR